MPTVITHAATALALGAALGIRTIPPRLLLAGAAAAVLPDIDVIAFKLGIAYGDQFGHRGASHSLFFAVCIGLLGAISHRSLRCSSWVAAIWLFVCTASHPLLDALTDGGLGVALLWPWNDVRLFAPWRPIEVSPIGGNFFSDRGLAVLWSELRWVLLPTCVLTLLIATIRFRLTKSRAVS